MLPWPTRSTCISDFKSTVFARIRNLFLFHKEFHSKKLESEPAISTGLSRIRIRNSKDPQRIHDPPIFLRIAIPSQIYVTKNLCFITILNSLVNRVKKFSLYYIIHLPNNSEIKLQYEEQE